MTRSLLFPWWASALLALASSWGCAPLQVGPFVPEGAKVCGADPDCPDHSACRYPSPSSRQSVCLTGRESDVYAWSPTPGPGGD